MFDDTTSLVNAPFIWTKSITPKYIEILKFKNTLNSLLI